MVTVLPNIFFQIEDLKIRFGEHTVLQNLEMRRKNFVNYQTIVLLLKNDKLRSRHWITLQVRSSSNQDVPVVDFKKRDRP